MKKSDERLVSALAGGLPRDLHPYRVLAEAVGLGEAEVLAKLRAMLADGRLRRMAAVVNQRQLGLQGNVMVVWDVPDERVEECGRQLAGRVEATHVYERPRGTGWPYNLYSMIHVADEAQARTLVEAWAADLRPRSYRLLATVREWKKSAPVYFT